jgi:tetratricopeptide (TPR) repeat protein
LGLLPDCDKHIREALKLLDSPIPSSNLQFGLGLFPQIVRQVFHWYFPSRHVGSVKGREKEVALEVARQYELISRIYFYSNETLPIMYTVLRFLNEAEKAGTSPELATAYSSMGVLAGFAQLHKLAERYVERGLAVGSEVNQLSNRITVGVVTSAYKITVGKWDEVREKVEEAKSLCEQLGDYRQWGDCTAMLGENALISGDLEYAGNIQRQLLEDARRRRSPLHQCWGLLGIARDHLRLGNEADAVSALEEALQILEQTPNLASSTETNGQLALAYFRLGQDDRAREYAQKVINIMGSTSPTVYSMNIGFAAVADVTLGLWDKSLHPAPTADSERYRILAEKSLKLLKAFQGVFPIGRPVTPYYRGWYEMLTGKRDAAIRSWQKGLEAAQKFNMPYEEALVRLKLGVHLKEDMETRREHFKQAIHLLEKMGRVSRLHFAKEEAQKAGF